MKTKQTAKKPESKIQAEILKYLKEKNIYAEKMIVGNRSGLPDIRCCVGGKFVAIEVKTGKNLPTPLQRKSIYDIEKSGGYAIVAYSLTEVINFINSIKGGVK